MCSHMQPSMSMMNIFRNRVRVLYRRVLIFESSLAKPFRQEPDTLQRLDPEIEARLLERLVPQLPHPQAPDKSPLTLPYRKVDNSISGSFYRTQHFLRSRSSSQSIQDVSTKPLYPRRLILQETNHDGRRNFAEQCRDRVYHD